MASDRITLTLYGPDDEPVKTLSRSGIRWNMLKKLVRFDEDMQDASPAERLETIIDAVACMFEGQATIEEIEAGCNYDEAVACFRQIMKMVTRQKTANFREGAATPAQKTNTRT